MYHSNGNELEVDPLEAAGAARIDDLLRQMNLSEKVGQMTQLTLAAVSCSTEHGGIDEQKLRQALVEHGVGSIFNVCDRALPSAQWHSIIRSIQGVAIEETRLGIPILYGIDSVHGANYTLGATLFPHNLGLAASWNPDLARQTAEFTALETRACGIPWTFAPVLDLGRQPLWSRFCETFGEDTHLARVMGRAVVEGLQSGRDQHHRVAACAKHFVGYGFPQSGKDRTPAYIPSHLMQDWFLPPFESAIAAGVSTIMVNSGGVNGLPVHASKELLSGVLRRDLGFDGVIVSDWEDVSKLHTVHRVAETERDAVRIAIEAGIDMSMTPLSLSFHEHLVGLVEDGEVSEVRIDESVRRILRLKSELGLFENPYPDADSHIWIGSDVARATNIEAARASITLLKNVADTLPLATSCRLLVTGPAADSIPALHGPWSYTWQGSDKDAYPDSARSLLKELNDRGTEVLYHPGTTWSGEIDIEAAVAAARTTDVALVCLGETPSVEKPGDIDDLSLDSVQIELANRIAGSGTPTVVILVAGRPRIIRECVDQVSAIVMAYQPGGEGAHAIADVLFGVVNPTGRLPFTYPRYTNDLVTYDHRASEQLGRSYGLRPDYDMDAFQPQFEFGFGLSYTRFNYSDLLVDTPILKPRDTFSLRVDVENVGDREGAEVVQLYIRDHYATLDPPVKRLKAFTRIWLQPGEKKTVVFELSTDTLRFAGMDGKRRLEAGLFTAEVGGIMSEIRLSADERREDL